jgi:hypothetical protein
VVEQKRYGALGDVTDDGPLDFVLASDVVEVLSLAAINHRPGSLENYEIGLSGANVGTKHDIYVGIDREDFESSDQELPAHFPQHSCTSERCQPECASQIKAAPQGGP